MTIKLFALRGVPEDEAQEVRDLLTAHGIDWYETPPGNWGISMPAIWLRRDDQIEDAQALLEDYQRQRRIRQREAQQRLRREGRARTVIDELKEKPLRFVLYLAFALLVLYVSTKPFVDFGR